MEGCPPLLRPPLLLDESVYGTGGVGEVIFVSSYSDELDTPIRLLLPMLPPLPHSLPASLMLLAVLTALGGDMTGSCALIEICRSREATIDECGIAEAGSNENIGGGS